MIINKCVTKGEKEKTTLIVHKSSLHRGGNDLGLSRHLVYLFEHNLSIRPDQDIIIQWAVMLLPWIVSLHCRWNPASSALLCDWKSTLWRQEIIYSVFGYICIITSSSHLFSQVRGRLCNVSNLRWYTPWNLATEMLHLMVHSAIRRKPLMKYKHS